MRNLIYLFFCAVICACSTQTVSVDYDRSQDFSLLKEYTIEFAENSMSDLDKGRIQSAIQHELSLKSMQLNQESSIVLKIIPEEFISESQDSQVGIGVGGGSYGFGTSIGIGIPISSKKLNQKYLVSLYNDAQELVWDGRLEIQMPANATSEILDKNVQKGVSKLFKKFPPAQ